MEQKIRFEDLSIGLRLWIACGWTGFLMSLSLIIGLSIQGW